MDGRTTTHRLLTQRHDLRQPRDCAPEAIRAAVRPEKYSCKRSRRRRRRQWYAALQDIAYLGDLSIYLVRLPTGKVVRVTRPNTSRHAEAIGWDQQVYLSWDATSPVVVTR